MTSTEELTRIEQFIAAYNEIDDFLQNATGKPQTFRSSVDYFAKRNPWWSDAEMLRVYATLRNFLIHEKTRPFDYPCAPSDSAVRDIAAIRDRLLDPPRLLPVFERAVVTLSPEDCLDVALSEMHIKGHRRFPVYEGGRFLGMLSESGIARWLAEIVAQDAPIDLRIPVHKVLPRERQRPSHRFAAGQTPVSEAAYWFRENTFLETLLITSNGQPSAHLRGIVTRGDIAGWGGEGNGDG
jgi:CBS domain-containing protein